MVLFDRIWHCFERKEGVKDLENIVVGYLRKDDYLVDEFSEEALCL